MRATLEQEEAMVRYVAAVRDTEVRAFQSSAWPPCAPISQLAHTPLREEDRRQRRWLVDVPDVTARGAPHLPVPPSAPSSWATIAASPGLNSDVPPRTKCENAAPVVQPDVTVDASLTLSQQELAKLAGNPPGPPLVNKEIYRAIPFVRPCAFRPRAGCLSAVHQPVCSAITTATAESIVFAGLQD